MGKYCLVMEFLWGGSATNGATPSGLFIYIELHNKL